jgi:hypothetical protein
MESVYFASHTINLKKLDNNDPDEGVSIYPDQVNVGYKYTNRLEENVLYILTIQRSTGRFAESFRVEEEKVPFTENTGYCVYR